MGGMEPAGGGHDRGFRSTVLETDSAKGSSALPWKNKFALRAGISGRFRRVGGLSGGPGARRKPVGATKAPRPPLRAGKEDGAGGSPFRGRRAQVDQDYSPAANGTQAHRPPALRSW